MKFTTPVSMPCTKEQYERYLKDSLLAMGYELKDTLYWGHEDCQYLGNFYNVHGSHLGNISNADIKIDSYIDHYNPELFLALAAMTEGDVPIVGEWMKSLKAWEDRNFSYDTNELVRKSSNDIDLKGGINSAYSRIHFRKATKEELIAHLTKKKIEKEKIYVQTKFKAGQTVYWLNSRGFIKGLFSLVSFN